MTFRSVGQCMADTSISGARIVRKLDALVQVYGKPASIVSENGTEFISRAILKWANENDVEWHDIDPRKPKQNTFIKSLPGSPAPLSWFALQTTAGNS